MFASTIAGTGHYAALRRLRAWRRARRNHVPADSDGDAERRRSPSLARRRPQQDRRSPNHLPCRAASLELENIARDHATYRCCRLIRGAHRMVTPEVGFRRSMAGLRTPLSTLRIDPRGPPRMTR